ncbi:MULTISPECIES: hypothetical protein [unclassified Streptomyces]|uniref:hypothetical protein n=1 Tax=unclassified Streptomyces TaxID=2593676 RepID=UPI0037FBC00A
MTEPEMVFADAPTAPLDPESAELARGLLRDAVRRDGRTIVMVIHDPGAAGWADTALATDGGRLRRVRRRRTLLPGRGRLLHIMMENTRSMQA